MELGLIWIGCAALTAIAAGARGRSALGWFCLGLAFGVFALIAVLVMARGDPVASGPAMPLTGSGDFARMGSGRVPSAAEGYDLGVYRGYQMLQRADGVHAAGLRHASPAEARAHIDQELGA